MITAGTQAYAERICEPLISESLSCLDMSGVRSPPFLAPVTISPGLYPCRKPPRVDGYYFGDFLTHSLTHVLLVTFTLSSAVPY